MTSLTVVVELGEEINLCRIFSFKSMQDIKSSVQ